MLNLVPIGAGRVARGGGRRAQPPVVRGRPSRTLLTTMALAACQDPVSGGLDEAARSPVVHVVSGDQQVAAPGEPLGIPFVIEVRQRSGAPLAGLRVTWSVTSGLGAFHAPGPTVTDGSGRSTMSFTPQTSRVTVRAELESRPGVWTGFTTVPRQLASYDRLTPAAYCYGVPCEVLVLYEDASFGVRVTGAGEWSGKYSRRDSVLTLALDADRMWGATATLRGDSLFLKYNAHASLSDFEDGTYLLTQGKVPIPQAGPVGALTLPLPAGHARRARP